MQKKEFIKFRCTGLEKAIIKKKSDNSGLSLSDYCRKTAMDQKIGYKLTADELECYQTLAKFHNNFRSISNLLKNKDSAFAGEVMVVINDIKEHFQKFK